MPDIWTDWRADTDEHRTDTDRQRPDTGPRWLRRATLLSQGGTKPAPLPPFGRLKSITPAKQTCLGDKGQMQSTI